MGCSNSGRYGHHHPPPPPPTIPAQHLSIGRSVIYHEDVLDGSHPQLLFAIPSGVVFRFFCLFRFFRTARIHGFKGMHSFLDSADSNGLQALKYWQLDSEHSSLPSPIGGGADSAIME